MKRLFSLVAFSAILLLLPIWRPTHAGTLGDTTSPIPALAEVLGGEGSRVTRFLVLGKDRSSGLTDSIFVVSIDETARRASILQIPRDTYANYTDKDYKKLNGALGALGENGVKQLLSRALGVRLDYFFILDLSCVRLIVDDIGGVDVEIEQDMTYSDPAQGLEIDLHRGIAHLDGRTAEHFIRYRAGYVNADLGRLDAQKRFLGAFATKSKSLSASQLFSIMCHSLTRVQTDIGLPDAIRVLSVLRECDTESIPMATLAGEAVQGNSGAWYYAVNRAGACRMAYEYLMVSEPMETFVFDPNRLFDRSDHREFHKIYTDPEDSLVD